eukprot:jgi/Tetstr1/461181/TSEL_006318.t1
MTAAKEMRHWNPEAHIGDDGYVLVDVKAAVAEATAGTTTGEQEMRSGAPTRRDRGIGAPTRRGRGSGAPTRRGRGSGAPTRRGRCSAAPTRGGRRMLVIHAAPHT